MENNTLKVSMDINFSLIGTQPHVVYERNEGGYAIPLVPSEQAPDSSVSVKNLIDDIKNMARGVTGSDTTVDTTQLEKAMIEAVKKDGSTSMKLEDIVIKLRMAYLHICKKGKNSVLEYAFQLQVVTEGLVPETIKSIVDVTNPPISVWNADKKKIVDKMVLVTVNKYPGAATLPDENQAAK